MILINAKREMNDIAVNIGYGLLVILINAKLNNLLVEIAPGYGLLVILINAKQNFPSSLEKY